MGNPSCSDSQVLAILKEQVIILIDNVNNSMPKWCIYFKFTIQNVNASQKNIVSNHSTIEKIFNK